MTESQTASPWGHFEDISAFKAVFCLTPHSKCKPSLILGSCTQKMKGCFLRARGSHVLQQVGFRQHSSESKSVQRCCLLIMLYYNTSYKIHSNCPELQRGSIWLWIVCDRWQSCWQLVQSAMQIASDSLLPDIDLQRESLWKQTECTVTSRTGCQFQMSGLCYCRFQSPVHRMSHLTS